MENSKSAKRATSRCSANFRIVNVDAQVEIFSLVKIWVGPATRTMSRDNEIRTGDEAEEAKDTIDDTDSDGMDADNIRPFIKDSVYYAAKDGLSIALFALLSSVESMATKNAIINQVS